MAEAALSIKLRCASWQQLATIYRRDLSRGSMFLKASTQPSIGTTVRIDLELPSATVIELIGVITSHVVDPQRGTGVDLKLEPLPTKSVWLIESALAAENKVRAATAGGTATPPGGTAVTSELTDGQDVAAAEQELVGALEAEAESLRKLNPFLVLGVGYETTDADVRAAFGELTKRYHPDRFARYQSAKLRQIAAEIFILIRDAYRKLADEAGRASVIATLGPRVPPRAAPPPRPSAPPARPSGSMRVAVPPPIPKSDGTKVEPPKPTLHDSPTKHGAYDAPTNPSGKSAELAGSDLAKADQLAISVANAEAKSGKVRVQTEPPVRAKTEPPVRAQTEPPVRAQTEPPVRPPVDLKSDAARAPTEKSTSQRIPSNPTAPLANKPITIPAAPTPPAPPAAPAETSESGGLEAMMDEGKLDEALAGYRALVKKHPQDRSHRAGVELVEGLKALVARDRMEAAQRFEAALEIDPSNERAARELADMRRQATNERKGLLSRLMGKKEPP